MPEDAERPKLSAVVMGTVYKLFQCVGILVTVIMLALGVVQFAMAALMGFGFNGMLPTETAVQQEQRKTSGTANQPAAQPDPAATAAPKSPVVEPHPSAVALHAGETELVRVPKDEGAAIHERRAKIVKDNAAQALVFAIHGLEFVLMAPICFILTRSLLMYIVLRYMNNAGESAVPSLGRSAHTNVKAASEELLSAKALVTGLLGGIIAVDLVSRLLESNGEIDPHLWVMVLALMVVGGYYVALEWVARRW